MTRTEKIANAQKSCATSVETPIGVGTPLCYLLLLAEMADTPVSPTVKIVTGTSNVALARSVASTLNLELTPAAVGKFADGETSVHVEESVRGADVFVIQPICPPNVNDALQELILLLSAMRSSAKRITAIVPYYAYARQDRKNKPRVPISAAAVARQILSAEPDRLLLIDLHCGQIQGFFGNTPVDHLSGQGILAKHVDGLISTTESGSKFIDNHEVVIVSPDAGGMTRARRFADALAVKDVATILKRRVEANAIESMQLVGTVENSTCIVVDDMIDTAGTLVRAAQLLIDNGAHTVYAVATHGLFSGEAIKCINNSMLDMVFVTDTIDQTRITSSCNRVMCLSIAPLLAQGITAIHNEQSVSATLFGFENAKPQSPLTGPSLF